MKRTKLLLSVLASFLLAFVMVFAAACDSNTGNGGNGNNNGDYGITDSSKDGLSLDHISLSGYTETFELGDAFSTGNLVVTATLIDYNTSDSAVEEETLNASQYTVDSSEYNANRVGTYTIFVSHTRSGVTRTAHYKVDVTPVKPAYGGIVVKLAEGESATYTLTTENPSATVSKDILAVYEVGADGEVSTTPLAANAYGADLYLGSKKIENNTTNEGGVYSLVAYLVADSTKKDYIPVYVVNPVTKIELANAETAKTEQDASSKDELSSTWEFTVTYSNGFTKTVKAGDAGLTIGIDTRVAGENKTANVKYVEVDASGASHEVTTTVTYTIKAKEVEGDSVTYELTYTANTEQSKFVSSWGASGEDLSPKASLGGKASSFKTHTTSNAPNGTKSTNGGSEALADYVEIKDSGNKDIIVTIGSNIISGTIQVYASSTTATTDRTTYLATAATVSDTNGDGKIDEKDDNVLGALTVDGTDVSKDYLYILSGDIESGKSYYVYTNGSANTMHVYRVVITYTVATSGSSTVPDPITVSSGDLAVTSSNYAEATAWGDSGIITILDNCSVDASAKSVDGVSIANRLKTNGGATTERQSIKIDLSSYTGKATIRVACRYGGANRSLVLLSAEKSTTSNAYWTGTDGGASADTSAVFFEEIPVDCGAVYYLGGTNNMGIYKIVITFEQA